MHTMHLHTVEFLSKTQKEGNIQNAAFAYVAQLLSHKYRNYISAVPTKFFSQQNVMEM